MNFLTTVTIVKKNTFGNSNLTHLTTDVMFSGQHFAILVIFLWGGYMIFLWRGSMIFLLRGCVILFVERLRDYLSGEVARFFSLTQVA